MYNYKSGIFLLESNNINELKEFSNQINDMAKEAGQDLPKHLSDICFSIDADYQAFHGLHEDNWDMIH